MRKLGELVGRSKSATHRHIRAKKRRDLHPESHLWETEEGDAWLRLQVFATLFMFGLKSGIGTQTLSQYFKMIRVDTHVGVSETALRTQLGKMEALLPQFQQMCEDSLQKQPRKIVAGVDETFFGQFLILVMMDLKSGYLLLEEISDDRCFESWHAKAAPRLEQLGIEVDHAISDRAKALVKLALAGFECESGADVFHAQQDVSRFLGASLKRRVKAAEKALEKAQSATGKALKVLTGFKLLELKVTLLKAEKAVERYHENMQGVGDEIHPFSLEDNSVNNAEKIEQRLEVRAQAFERIAAEQEINDHKGSMKKLATNLRRDTTERGLTVRPEPSRRANG